jgi:hypothetical protein
MLLFVGVVVIDGVSKPSWRIERVYVLWRERDGVGWTRGLVDMAVMVERLPLNRSGGTCEIEESWLVAPIMSGDNYFMKALKVC